MKIVRLERLRRLQQQYHQCHPWRLSQGGLFIPHSYADMKPESLSWWDDVGFILNGRRVIVWWRHPRHVYADALEAQSWLEAGDGPQEKWLIIGGTKNYRRVGRSRKKLVSYTIGEPSSEQQKHYDLLRDILKRLTDEGIDLDVSISWKWERLTWAMGVSLVAPLEVRNEGELASVANLARRLILGQTTLEAEFPAYSYGRSDWLREQVNSSINGQRILATRTHCMTVNSQNLNLQTLGTDGLEAGVEVTAMATRVLGTAELAENWLNRPALALDGRRPLDLLTTAAGNQDVIDLLGRLEHGVYT